MDNSNKTKCPNCSAVILNNDNFCSRCGSKIEILKITGNNIPHDPLPNIMAYLFIGLFVLLIILILFLNNTQEKRPETQVKETLSAPSTGQQMIENQKINELKSFVEKHPKDLNALISLANTLHDNGMPNEAIPYYGKYLELKENDPDARIDMGICFFEIGDNKNAVKEIEKALKFSPRHQKAYFNIGIISLNEGNTKKSNEYFKKCYEIDPSSATGIQAKEILDQHKNLKSNNK